jgi:hypothetical protein
MKIQWEEPVEFSQAYVQSTGTVPTRRGKIFAGFITAGVVAALTLAFEKFFYLLHNKDLGVPLYFHFVAPIIAGVFVAFLPFMVSVIPSKIILTEKGIHRNKPIGTIISMQFWPWESITELAIEDVRYGEGVYRVLVVRSHLEQGEILIGLGGAPLNRINEAVAQMGKTLVNRVPGAP